MPITVSPATLEAHRPYGIDLRHDIVTLDGPTIPAWSTVVNLGAPDGATVSRTTPSVDLLVIRTKYGSPVTPGTLYRVRGSRLLVASGHAIGTCECTDNPWCHPNDH